MKSTSRCTVTADDQQGHGPHDLVEGRREDPTVDDAGATFHPRQDFHRRVDGKTLTRDRGDVEPVRRLLPAAVTHRVMHTDALAGWCGLRVTLDGVEVGGHDEVGLHVPIP